ncbi:chemerin-like receptor 1 [Lissotriton helveticus]
MDSERACIFLLDLRDILKSVKERQFTDTMEGLRISSLVISVITCILGLVGNSVVIWVAGFKMKKGKAMAWFLNLAVADLVFLLCLSMKVLSLFTGQWYFGEFFCKFYQYVFNLNMYVSIFILTVLSVDRCLSVALPLWHLTFVSKHFSRRVCLVIWILTMVMSIPGLCFGHLEKIDNTTRCAFGFYRSDSFNFNNMLINSSTCQNAVTLKDRTQVEEAFTTFARAFQNGVAAGDLPKLNHSRQDCQTEKFWAYFEECVNKDLIKKWNDILTFSERFIIPLLIFGFLIPLVTITLTNIITIIKGQRALRKTSSKLYQLIIVMVATYFFAWTPLAVVETVFIIAAHKLDLELMLTMSRVLPLVSSISSFHSCLNPILYVLLSGTVRNNMTESFNKVWTSLSSRPTSTTQCSRSKL